MTVRSPHIASRFCASGRLQWITTAVLVMLNIACPMAVQAQTTLAPEKTAQDMEAQYRACPMGYYSGPRPGRSRYTKDEYLWVVTPAFAAEYCMPTEFVDPTLKGAEAIAYRPVQDGAEYCDFGGSKESCDRGTSHGFEIYYKSSLKLPSWSKTKYNYRAFYMLPSSKHLIGPHITRTPAERKVWNAARPGAQVKFIGWGFLASRVSDRCGPSPHSEKSNTLKNSCQDTTL